MPKGWTFMPSIQGIGDIPGDRVHLMPFDVAIADKDEASASLKRYLGALEGTEIRPAISRRCKHDRKS